MFKFFLRREWLIWSYIGAFIILGGTFYQVQLDVDINEWFGEFYNIVQKALSAKSVVSLDQFMSKLFEFGVVAGKYIFIAVFLDFFVKHFVFRWRTSMNEYYTENWDKIHLIEGASQRIQEDTMRFARIMESLGLSFFKSILILISFLPILFEKSQNITELPWIGHVDHALFYVAILFALFGTIVLAFVGIRLPGLEFENQKVEAAYRKYLVLGEDTPLSVTNSQISNLFGDVRKNYFRLFCHYLYFDIVKFSYLQFGVLVPYIALAPTIIAGTITLGVMQEIIRAFGKIENSFQYLVHSWTTVVELISIYKRLRSFEKFITGDI